MKFLFPIAVATFAALASAGGDPLDECSDLAAKVPLCANDCVNSEADKFCDSGDYECICATETLDKIFDGSEDCVAKACKGAGPVFPPLRDYCQCLVPETKPPTPTTTPTPEPTPSCAAEEEKIPDCAQNCVNSAAYKYCEPGELECSCAPETLEKIIEDSTDCVAKACKDDAKLVFPLLRDFCECSIGDDDDDEETTTTSTPVEPTETASTSSPAEPTTSETSEPEPPTSTSEPVPTPTETESPEEPPSETCAADETETVTVTATVCGTQPGGPDIPGPTYVPVPPTGTPVVPPPPEFTAAAAVTQRNAGLVAGVFAIVAGVAYL